MISGHSPRWLLIAGIALIFASLAALLIPRSTNPGSLASVGDDLCIVAPATPYDPASGQQMLDPRPVPAEARCPVCGMYPARFPRWAAQIIFKDGSAHFFDSPVDLFMFLEEPKRFDATHTAEDAAAMYVADHRSGTWLEARQAAFVIDSSARGPMRGPDLPAFADLAAAQAFVAERGGRALAFDEVDRSVMNGLRSSTHAGHTH